MKKNKINKIYITLYNRKSFKSGKMWWQPKTKEQIIKIENYLKRKLPFKKIEIWDEDGKIYKKAKKWKVRAITIDLAKPLIIDHKEEYEKIYKPIDKFLFKNGFPIYNMWGYSTGKMQWQMDGRHAH